MSGDRRRELILQAAFDLFSKRGFSGTTTKDIAKASGVSEAMVYKHFASKDELYAAIFNNKQCHQGHKQLPWEENKELISAMEADDDFGVFYHFAVRALDKQQEDIGFMRMVFYSALEEHAMAETFFTEFVGKLYEFLGAYIKKRQKEGALRKIEPKIVVRAFMGMLIHHSLNNILWDKKRTILNITNKEAAKNFAELIMNGTKVQAV